MTEQQNLLNTIHLKTGETLIGIVDYITTKQIYFFDFTKQAEFSPDILFLAMMWRGNSLSNTRFSVYCAINYPGLELPEAKLIPVSNIEDCDFEITQSPKAKQRKRKIRQVKLKAKEPKRKAH